MPWWKKEEKADDSKDKQDPEYVTKDDLTSLKQEIVESLNFIKTSFIPPEKDDYKEPEPLIPKIDDVTDDEYHIAIENLQNPEFDGDRRAQMRVIQKRESASKQRLKQEILEEVNQRHSRLEPILHTVNDEVTRRGLQELPYYKLFKKEIDATLAKVPLENRNMQMANIIHNQIVASNQPKVVDYEIEQRANIQKQSIDATIPSRSSTHKSDKVTFSSQFGEDIADENATIPGGIHLWDSQSRSHRSPEDFARSRGYKSADDYAQLASSMNDVVTCKHCFVEILDGECHCEAIEQFIGKGRISLPG